MDTVDGKRTGGDAAFASCHDIEVAPAEVVVFFLMVKVSAVNGHLKEAAFDAGFNLTGVSRILTRVFGTAQASFQLEYLAVNGKGGIPKFRLLIVKRDFGEVVDVLYP